MRPIPNQLIIAMPDKVEASKESCQAAADATLHVLFLMGGQLDSKLTWPPIISNGHELWKMPTPYDAPPTESPVPLLVDLNGGGDEIGGYLSHCRRNAEEYNEALEEAPDVAKDIARMGPTDAGHVWNYLNALACSVEDEDVYRPIELSTECKQAFYIAVGIDS